METFKTISWNVPVDAETDFASADEFQSISLAYKILHGSFKAELSSDSSDELSEFEMKSPVRKKTNKAKKTNRKSNKEILQEKSKNISFEIDENIRYSSFTAIQHASYVDMLRVIQTQRIDIPTAWQEMKKAVELEQKEFLEHICELWKTAYGKHRVLSDDAKKFTEDIWKRLLRRVALYPQFYRSLGKIPLVYADDKPDVQMVPVKVLLQMGVLPKFYPPSGAVTSKISADYSTMLLLSTPNSDEYNSLLHVPVSNDRNAEILAVTERADVVISSSGLKCIADNLSKFDKVWSIPIVVKQYKIKDSNSPKYHKVVYVDKKLPAKTMSYSERNAWFHKLAVKCLLCHHRDPTAFRYPEKQLIDMNVEFTQDQLAVSQKKSEDIRADGCRYNCKSAKPLIIGKRTSQQDSNTSENISSQNSEFDDNRNMENATSSTTCSDDETPAEKGGRCSPNILQNENDYLLTPPPSKTNVTYRMWKLNCEKRCKEDLKKMFLKGQKPEEELKVLVRCKVDACEHDDHNEVLPVCISSKMEHQAEYGAEKINVSTFVREWTALFFRPEANMRRIRIDAMTEEVIMTEKVTLRDITVTASRLYDLSIRRIVLGSLYQVLTNIVALKPGHYILAHDSQNGPFACVLQQTNEKFNYDLHADYDAVNPAIVIEDSPQWPPIDLNLITPRHIATKQIPATFQPVK